MLQATLDQEVAKRLADKNPSVKEAIITSKVDEELNKRKAIAVDTLKRIAAFQKRLTDMEQDAMFDGDGKPLMTGFNAKQNKERKKIKEDMDKLETALANALGEKADWSGLDL